MSNPKWSSARKKPVLVRYREVIGESELIHTYEGDIYAYKDRHFIIKGIEGEEYPILKHIFYQTYNEMDLEHEARFPILVEDPKCIETIEMATSLEWYAEHAVRNYRAKMAEVFDLLEAQYDLDKKKYIYMVNGTPPYIYLMGLVSKFPQEIPKEKDDETTL